MKSIYLTGFLGSTKASVGRILAGSLGFRFLDLDYLIEAGAGLKVAEIFQIFGEERFRELEGKAIVSLIGMEDLVVAGGGGIMSHADNLPLMKKNGHVVHMDVSFDEISHRLLDQQSKYIPSIEQKMRALFEDRRERYLAVADIVVAANESRYVIDIVGEIERAVLEKERLQQEAAVKTPEEQAEEIQDVLVRETADVAKNEPTVAVDAVVPEKKRAEEKRAEEKQPKEKREGLLAKLGKSLAKTPEEKDAEEQKEQEKRQKQREREWSRQREQEEDARYEELERQKIEEEERNEERMKHAKVWKPERIEGQEKSEPLEAPKETSAMDPAEARRASAEAAMKRMGLEPKVANERPAFRPRGKM